MEAIKTYTDLSQSKTLSKILPLESADMYYTPPLIKGHIDYIPHLKRKLPIDWNIEQAIPCWSLSALLNVLPESYQLTSNKEGKVQLMLIHQLEMDYYNNPVDAVVNMIIRLNELNLL